MRPKKICEVKTHGPMGVDATIGVPWEDVWLRVHRRRETLRLAPCLISRVDLRGTIALYTQCAEKTDHPDDMGLGLTEADWEASREHHRSEVKKLEAILAQLEKSPHVVVDPGRCRLALADVYTANDRIDRAEAERMLDVYLTRLGVYRVDRYRWPRPALFAWPVSFPDDSVASDIADGAAAQ